MTSPVVVGSVSVEVQASAKGFAKSLRDAVTSEFKSAGLDKALSEAIGNRKIKVPVEPVFDEKSLPKTLPSRPSTPKTTRAPKDQLPDPSPLLKAFQQDVQRQVRSLSREALKIPVTPDTEGLRNSISAALADIQRRAKARIPTEPADQREYQRQLTAMVDDVGKRIKAKIPVEEPKPVRLRVDVDRASVRQATTSLSGLTSAFRGVSGAVLTLGKIGAIGGAAAAGIAGLASAAGGAVQLLVGLASAAVTASGALFALPGAAAIAGAGIGALVLGFAGITNAVKESAKVSTDGGAAIADAAARVAQAQRGLEGAERSYQAALRESKRAQEDLTAARKAAIERIDDLSRAVRGARLDERDAALRVADALDALNTAQVAGNPREIERATVAYEQSVLALENAKDAAKDLSAEQQDAAKRGVDGSAEVQAALDRQQSAADGLASATDALATAQDALVRAQQKSGGGLNAVAQAMARLAPAAQDVVRTLMALLPAWQNMQRTVQQTLFTGVAGDLTRLSASILPAAQAGFVGIASVLNGQFRAALAELATANSRIQLDTIFRNAKQALDGLTVAVRPLIQAFLDVSAVGSQIVSDQTTGLGQLIADLSTRLSALARSGELTTIINNGLDMLKAFGAAAADVFGIVKGIFTAVPPGGGGLFALLDTLNKLANSAAGQSAITDLFTNLAQVGAALAPVLLAVAQALGPVSAAIGKVAVAFAPTLVGLVQSLGGALASLAPALIALTPLVGVLASGLQPLANILVGLVTAAAPGLTAFVAGLVAALQALAPAAAPVGQALGAIAQAIAPLLPIIGQQLANVFTVLATVITGQFSVWNPLIEVFGQVGAILAGALFPAILSLAENLLPVMADAGVKIAEAFTPLIPVITQIAQLFAARLAAAMPGLVASFAAIVPSVVGLAQALGGALLAALQAIIPHLPELIDSGLKLVDAFLRLTAVLLPVLPQILQLGVIVLTLALNSGVLETSLGLMTFALNLAAGVIKIITGVVNALKNPLDTISGAASKMGNAIKDGAGSAFNAVRELPGKVKNALGDLGGLLYDAGKSVIQGLINGIKSVFGSLESTLNWVTDRIPDWKGPADKDRTLLQPAGRLIMQGLIGGIHGERSALAAELAGVTSDIAVGGQASMAGLSPASLPAATPGAPIELRFGGDAPDSFFRWMRDNTRVYYGGSAQAAIGYGGS